MKLGTHLPLPNPTQEEKLQQLKDLEIGNCFRFFNGISYEDALKTYGQSFFFVTEANGPKPAEDKKPCITFDMRQHRVLDGDRMVILHEVNAAIMPAVLINIAKPLALIDGSDPK